MKITLAFIILLQILFAREYSYEMLKQSAISKSLEMKLYKMNIEIQNMVLKETYSSYYPSVDLSGNSEYSKDLTNNDLGVQTIGNSVISSNTSFANSLSLNLNYILYDFGFRREKVAIQKKELFIKKFEFCQKRVEIFKKILDFYKNALDKRVYISSFNEMLNFRNKLYESKKRLYKAGEISKSDIANEAINIVELENNLRLKEKEYNEVLYNLFKLSGENIQRNDILKPFKNQKIILNNKNFQDTIEARIIDKRIEQKQKELSLLKDETKPIFSLYSSYNLYGSDTDSYRHSLNDLRSYDYKIGIGFKWKLFDGYSNKHKISKTLLELKKLKIQKKFLRQEFETKKRILKNNIKYSLLIKEQNIKQKRDLIELENIQNRLRNIKKVDLLTYLEKNIRIVDKKMTIKLQDIQRSYELEMLKLQNEEAIKCTRH